MTDTGPTEAWSDHTPEDRDLCADDRDRTSDSHDHTADERDELAARRDQRAEARDTARGRTDLDAAADRNAARRDRRSAEGDRRHAANDRLAARTDRSLSSKERAALLRDALTGCYRRESGFLELEREIIKAERTDELFTLVFIDVNHLKSVNDTFGHDAGDHLLCDVVNCVRKVTREYDVVVRYGGDEFICGMVGVPTSEVVSRFERANAALRAADNASVSVGVVERKRGEDLASLIERADTAMYESRKKH